jgi:hypothetical protein
MWFVEKTIGNKTVGGINPALRASLERIDALDASNKADLVVLREFKMGLIVI